MRKQSVDSSRFVLLLSLALSLAASGQEIRIAPAARHSLWRVQGSSNVVYLLGSIHLLNRTNYPLAPAIQSAFTNAAIAAFETEIDQMETPEAQQQILSRAMLPEGQTLQQELSPPVYATLNNHVQAAGLPPAMFDQFKPAMAAMTLEVIEMQKLGADPEYGLDQYYFKQARKRHLRIVPLETVDFQIDLVTRFDREEGELLVKTTLEDIDNTKKVLDDMVAAWQTGDSVKLQSLLNEAMREAPVIFKRLVTDRNQRWVPKIEELLRGDNNAIVIVGAGHLVGKDGVVELLQKKGWKVTQL